MTDFSSKYYISYKNLLEVDKEFYFELSTLLNTKNARQLLWHELNETITKPKCPVCSKDLGWHPDKREYRKFCSKKCTGIGTKDIARKTNISKYGIHFTKTKEYRDKVKKTCSRKYGVEHYSKTSEYKSKVKSTNLDRYGYRCASQSQQVKEKVIDTCLKKYGVTNPAKLKKSKEKVIDTCLKKYGVPSSQQKHYSKETLKYLNDSAWLRNKHYNDKLTVNEISKILNISYNTVNIYFKKFNIDIKFIKQSSGERKIISYINNLKIKNIHINNRTIIKPYEIDIYLPEYNLAIEYNGIYWHRPEKFGSKIQWFLYHQNKEELCNLQGIRLLHIWENYDDHYILLNNAFCGIISNNLNTIYKELYE